MSWAVLLGRRRWQPAAALVLIVAVAVVVLVESLAHGSLTYYRTPTELLGQPPATTTSIRVGGLVVPGSVRHRGPTVRFVLTDGAHDLHVVSDAAPPSTFRAGQGALVEGHLLRGGVFRAVRVLVRHSNEYRPPATSGG